MRGRAAWAVLGLLLCVAAGLWWMRGRQAPAGANAAPPSAAAAPSPAISARERIAAIAGPKGTIATTPAPTANTVTPAESIRYRLSNAKQSERDLLRNDRAILLANALIDTTQPLGGLNIPDNLRAPADNQNWIVQANGPLDARFRALLAGADVQVVSYIPNNAELVIAPANVASRLADSPLVASVLPYEPYYKLTDPALLKVAVTGVDLPADVGLRLGVFPGAQDSTLAALVNLGADVVASEPTPFGPSLKVHPANGTFLDIARLPGVMVVEALHQRLSANDLMRLRIGVSANTVSNNNYLNLTGLGVNVNVNDSGVDSTHPDFTGPIGVRVTWDPNTANGQDANGHGTHVIGTILGNGSKSGTVGTNASGSLTNASFQGMATNASAFVIGLGVDTRPQGVVGAPISDAYLQETAAATNVFISNNSWDYDGDAQYDMAAASYDAAVRDAIPEVTGPQPLLYVFSAGNDGGAATDGTGGIADTILSPGTAKNVITVGSIEQLRNLTNKYVVNKVTNTAWQVQTDSSNQVAYFSSRGNVGVEIEGPAGRFKPDVVAPGEFVVSDKSQQWNQAEYYNPTNYTYNTQFNQTVTNNSLAAYSIVMPANAVSFSVFVVSNDFSPVPFPTQLPVYVRFADNPTTNMYDAMGSNDTITVSKPPLPTGQRIFYSVGNFTNGFVSFDLITLVETTNDNGNLLTVLSNLNSSLGPYYRYESGTSMSAAGVSGMLALMQEFLEKRLGLSTHSPALMKALLINGARTLGSQYDFQTTGAITSQGWGLPNLSNSIPGGLTNGGTSVAMQFFDQATNMLATGQSATRMLSLANGGGSQPLRVTLVWTDPPGNPAAGVKLVNDLDLIVTNIDTGAVFYGNDIPAGSAYNVAHASTNNVPNPDSVNNVENVYLFPPLNTNYSITVYGHRVNVNAVDSNNSNVVQDYALVVSYGDGGVVSNAFTLMPPTMTASNTGALAVLTNALPLLNQRVGGNSQFAYAYSASTNGVIGQWQFYVYTNTAILSNAAYNKVAFVTYAPVNLGVPRMGTREEANPANGVRTEADVDLYVSQDPNLTNLIPAVLNNPNMTFQSRSRTGTEKVLLTNASMQPYYVGVKSEDQEGAQFALVGVALTNSFGQVDSNGNVLLTVIAPALPTAIPTGTPAHPGAVTVLALTTVDVQARKVVVEDTINHQEFGDLVGAVSHGHKTVVVNNHSFFVNPSDTTESFLYDDTGEVDDPYLIDPPFNTTFPQPIPPAPATRRSDGPGSTTTFIGDNISDGIWTLTMVNDSSPVDTGFINNLNLFVEPQQETNEVIATIAQNSWFYDFIDVPAAATNLVITVSPTTGVGVGLYLRRGALPDAGDFDKFQLIPSGGGQMTLGLFDSPPLNPGRYFIGLFNPNAAPVTVTVHWTFGLSLAGPQPVTFLSVGNEPIPDDAVMYSANYVGQNSRVVSTEVGVRIDHPRESDLVLTLVSPGGTRVLLAENRGGLDSNGYGSGTNTTNFGVPFTSGGYMVSTNIIPLGTNTSGTLLINYQFYTLPDDMRVYYGGTRIFDSGLISGAGTFSVDYGPGSATTVTIAMNEPGTNPNGTNTDQWNYTATQITKNATYAFFTEDTNKTTTPIKFAPPPFGGGAAFTPPVTNLMSSFETVAPGTYISPSAFEGWTVMNTNPVTVVNVPVLAAAEGVALDGVNVLALHNGGITRVLPTIAGQSYTLTFQSHGRPVANNPVGWWKGDGSTFDSSLNGNPGMLINGTVYTNGEVAQAFTVNGTNQYVDVLGNPAVLNPTSAVTLEAWINPNQFPLWSPIIKKAGTGIGTDDGYDLELANSSGVGFWVFVGGAWPQAGLAPVPLNQWSHVAGVYDGTNMYIYVNGAQVGPPTPVSGPITSSPHDLYLGHDPSLDSSGVTRYASSAIDEATVYSTPLSILQIQDIYAAGSAGKWLLNQSNFTVAANVVIAGQTNTFTAGDQWSNNVFTFVAPSSSTVLQIQSKDTNDDGMLVDSFQLVANPAPNTNNYYLPEETLDALQGENSQGNWKLEVLDNRLGATNPPPLLVSWELSLTLERVNPSATVLSPGIPVTNTVPPNYVSYFIVNVPPWAQFATNILNVVSNGPVSLLFNQNTLPLLTNGDVPLLPNEPTGGPYTYILTTAGAPPLLPGQSYYLAVTNSGPSPATVTLEVDFDITTLTNMVPVTSALPANILAPRYFQFNVPTAPPPVAAVSFLLYNLSDNATLVASKGFPLPTLTSHNYISANPGMNSDVITVTPGSAPVPLSPGWWYLGVFDTGTSINPLNYTIEAAILTPTVIPLTNDERLTITNISPLIAEETFFSFDITTSPPGALFEVYSMTADVDLTLNPVNVGPFAGPIFLSSTNPGTNDEQIVIRTNTTGPNPLTGTWYLNVPSLAPGNVTYTIHAVVTGTNGLLVSAVPILPKVTIPAIPATGPTLTWYAVNGECYEVDSSSDLINWSPLPIFPNPVMAAGSTISVVDPNPITGVPWMFYRIVQVTCP